MTDSGDPSKRSEFDVPGQQFGDTVHRMVGDDGEDAAQVGLGIDAVKLGGAQQAVHGGRTFAPGVRSQEEIVLSFMHSWS